MSIGTRLVHVSVLTVAALSYAAFAAGPPGFPTASAPSGAEKRLVVNDTASTADLAGQVVRKWEASLTQAYGWDQEGVEQLRLRVSALPAETLKNLMGASSWQRLTELMLDAERTIAAPAMAQKGFALDESNPDVAKIMRDSRKVLGDQNRDLVFIPTKPCRIFDTRFERSGFGSPYTGRYTGANTKNFIVASLGSDDFSAYGGNTGCAENLVINGATLAGVFPYAVMIKLTIVAPAAAGAYVSAVRMGDTNPAPNLVSAYCDQAGAAPCSATVVVPVCRGTPGCTGVRDISIVSNMALDLAGEVQGYFITPQATALECTLTPSERFSVPVGFDAYFYNTGSCGALGNPTSAYCYGANAPGVYSTGSGIAAAAFCAWKNLGSVPQNVYQATTCCRTPGR